MPASLPSLLAYWLSFALASWLGLYLLGRGGPGRPARYTALGLLAFAGAALDSALSGPGGPLGRGLLLLPVLCWSLTILHLLPARDDDADDADPGLALTGRASDGLLAALIPQFMLAGALFEASSTGYRFLQGVALAALLGAIWAMRARWQATRARPELRLAWVLAWLAALSAGLLLLSFEVFPPEAGLLLVCGDLLALGALIAAFDAFDAGERLLPDMLRSLLATSLAAGLTGALILADMAGGGASPALLFALTALAIASQTAAAPLQRALDRLTLPNAPELQAQSAELRAAAAALPRIDPAPDWLSMDDEEFARLTRRALSQLGDLPRLSASPLTRLGVVEAHLRAHDQRPDALARASALKALLTEAVIALKPSGQGDFGTTPEWRHYNALYFPYVVGLRPYSAGYAESEADLRPDARAALDWFRAQVPDRTLRNWQGAAARLVAARLRELEMTRAPDDAPFTA